MRISSFEPWAIVDLMHSDISGIPSRQVGNTIADGRTINWKPAVDVVEETDRFVIHADLPGVDPKDIEINMEKGVLSLSGERHKTEPVENAGVARIERASGRFDRKFNLPETADADAITARSGNGILEIGIPKLAEVQPRRITVEAA